ncbi:hypothetical protein DFH11DRAFT_1571252 [Phellopilus nigrolimitatus]|nr:hypothetical protein DFH11DRAFT_1571252 [Phellopilus nigrolimitatus]
MRAADPWTPDLYDYYCRRARLSLYLSFSAIQPPPLIFATIPPAISATQRQVRCIPSTTPLLLSASAVCLSPAPGLMFVGAHIFFAPACCICIISTSPTLLPFVLRDSRFPLIVYFLYLSQAFSAGLCPKKAVQYLCMYIRTIEIGKRNYKYTVFHDRQETSASCISL